MRIWYNHGYSQTRDALVLLRAADPSLTLVATHANPLTPIFLAADIHAAEPRIPRDTPAGARAYTDWCLAFAQGHRIDLFVAQRARGDIARRAADFAAIGTRVIVAADADTLATIDNKARFYAASAAAGLPTPQSHEITTPDAFDVAVAALRAAGHAPCVKPPVGVFASGFFRLDDATPLFHQLLAIDDRALPTAVIRSAIAGMGAAMPPLLVMQTLPGAEWSIDCLCDRGRILAGVARRKEDQTQVIETRGPAMDLAARVARVFDLSNLVNIQLKADAAGTPHVLEINPRMSGGCLYAALAGLNLPHLQFLLASGRLTPAAIPVPRPVQVAAVADAVDLGSLLAPSLAVANG